MGALLYYIDMVRFLMDNKLYMITQIIHLSQEQAKGQLSTQ